MNPNLGKTRGNKQSIKKIIYEKYFPSNKIDNILFDFEDYKACSRNGGTNSTLRDKGQKEDEDIRGKVVE